MSERQTDLLGENWAGEFTGLPISPLTERVGDDVRDDDLIIHVWGSERSSSLAGVLLERFGNRTVKLIGRYRFRYDPGRSSSTGAGKAPRGDYHLYDGDTEIAAWNDAGQSRHGFQPGHRLPKKAYDALVRQYPGMHGLKGRILECCLDTVSAGKTEFTLRRSE